MANDRHAVLNTSMVNYPEGTEKAIFAMGCFWGVERLFWQLDGVVTTACGYIGGARANPSYEQVCSGATGHAEAVLVVYRPEVINYSQLLKYFWEYHNPTQGMRQGNDRGSQYRSAIFVTSSHQALLAEASKQQYQQRLNERGGPAITTEILPAPPFYMAEPYHQQYLYKNPNGYCNMQSIQKTGLPEWD